MGRAHGGQPYRSVRYVTSKGWAGRPRVVGKSAEHEAVARRVGRQPAGQTPSFVRIQSSASSSSRTTRSGDSGCCSSYPRSMNTVLVPARRPASMSRQRSPTGDAAGQVQPVALGEIEDQARVRLAARVGIVVGPGHREIGDAQRLNDGAIDLLDHVLRCEPAGHIGLVRHDEQRDASSSSSPHTCRAPWTSSMSLVLRTARGRPSTIGA